MDNSEWNREETAFKTSNNGASSFLFLFWTVDKLQRHQKFSEIKEHLFSILYNSMTVVQKALSGYYQPLMFLVLGVYLTCKLVFDVSPLRGCEGSVYYNCLRYLEDNPSILRQFETTEMAGSNIRFFSQLIKGRVTEKLGKKGMGLVRKCLTGNPLFGEILAHDFFEDFSDPTEYEPLLDTQETLPNRGMLLRICSTSV